MPAYAGFKDLRDYLGQRFQRDETNQNQLSAALGWRRSYTNGIYHTHYKPSKKRCAQIAAHFGDNPRILYVLLGYESPDADLKDPDLRAIHDLAASLDYASRRKPIRLLRQLQDETARCSSHIEKR